MNLWEMHLDSNNDHIVDFIRKYKNNHAKELHLAPNNLKELGWAKVYNKDINVCAVYILDIEKVIAKFSDFDILMKQVKNLYRDIKLNELV